MSSTFSSFSSHQASCQRNRDSSTRGPVRTVPAGMWGAEPSGAVGASPPPMGCWRRPLTVLANTCTPGGTFPEARGPVEKVKEQGGGGRRYQHTPPQTAPVSTDANRRHQRPSTSLLTQAGGWPPGSPRSWRGQTCASSLNIYARARQRWLSPQTLSTKPLSSGEG